MHAGKIRVESPPAGEAGKLGKGSKFIFTLPKYDTAAIFKEYFTNGLRKAKQSGGVISLLVLHITNFLEIKEIYSPSQIQQLGKDLEGLIKRTLRRSSDITCPCKEGSIAIILPETGREGTLAVERRIKQTLREYIFKLPRLKDREIFFTSGIATYPEEGVKEEEMIREAECSKPEETILVVDDHPDIVKLMSKRLQVWGYETLSAYNGKDALKIIKAKLPDLVITDINMPLLDGFSLLKKMKETKRLSFIPVIFLTGIKKEFEDKVEGLTLGAADYILKPYDSEVLLTKIKLALNPIRLRSPTERPVG